MGLVGDDLIVKKSEILDLETRCRFSKDKDFKTSFNFKV